MQVEIYKDEMYPVYFIDYKSIEPSVYARIAELSEKDFLEYAQLRSEFYMWQDKLEIIFNKAEASTEDSPWYMKSSSSPTPTSSTATS